MGEESHRSTQERLQAMSIRCHQLGAGKNRVREQGLQRQQRVVRVLDSRRYQLKVWTSLCDKSRRRSSGRSPWCWWDGKQTRDVISYMRDQAWPRRPDSDSRWWCERRKPDTTSYMREPACARRVGSCDRQQRER